MISCLVRTLFMTLFCGSVMAHTTVSDTTATKSFTIAIDHVHDLLPGNYCTVKIVKESGADPVRGFNLLIDYDSTRMHFISGTLGGSLADSAHDWRVFSCIRENVDSVPEQRPSGLLRIAAAVDSVGQATSSSRWAVPDGATLAVLKFSTRAEDECTLVPIRFVWRDCHDNSFETPDDRQRLTAGSVLDWNSREWEAGSCVDLTGRGVRHHYSYGGIPSRCVENAKPDSALRAVTFRNGGVDFICIEGIDIFAGDINLNGIANEIGDLSLYAQYLLRGMPAMRDSLRKIVVDYSDVNADGRTLTIADLVYLLRIIIGDVQPYAKLRPYGDTVQVTFRDSVLSAASPAKIAGAYAVFDSDHDFPVESLCGLPVESYYDSASHALRVLLACMISSSDSTGGRNCWRLSLSSGGNRLFAIHGPVTLKSIQTSDYDGNILASYYETKRLPAYFSFECSIIGQPQSDTVSLDLYLPGKTDWQIDVLNSRSQAVMTFSGNDYGHRSMKWDWSDFLPGGYAFTVNAASFTATRTVMKWK